MVPFCKANDSNQWSLVFSPSHPFRWKRKLATPYEIVKPPELLYRNETMAGTTLHLPISGPQPGPLREIVPGVPRPIPEPLASGALAGTCIAFLHSSHNIDKTANMLRYAVEVDYLLRWQLTYTVCSTRNEILQPSRPFSPRAATARHYSLNTTIAFYSMNEWSNFAVSVWSRTWQATMLSQFT